MAIDGCATAAAASVAEHLKELACDLLILSASVPAESNDGPRLDDFTAHVDTVRDRLKALDAERSALLQYAVETLVPAQGRLRAQLDKHTTVGKRRVWATALLADQQGGHGAKRARCESMASSDSLHSLAAVSTSSRDGDSPSPRLMPATLQYECEECGHGYAASVQSSDNPLWALQATECVRCAAVQIPRLKLSEEGESDLVSALERHVPDVYDCGNGNGSGEEEAADAAAAAAAAAVTAAAAPPRTPPSPRTGPPSPLKPASPRRAVIRSAFAEAYGGSSTSSSSAAAAAAAAAAAPAAVPATATASSAAASASASAAAAPVAGAAPPMVKPDSVLLLQLMMHARGCWGQHTDPKADFVCRSTKLLMMHLRDCDCAISPPEPAAPPKKPTRVGGRARGPRNTQPSTPSRPRPLAQPCKYPWCVPCKLMLRDLVGGDSDLNEAAKAVGDKFPLAPVPVSAIVADMFGFSDLVDSPPAVFDASEGDLPVAGTVPSGYGFGASGVDGAFDDPFVLDPMAFNRI